MISILTAFGIGLVGLFVLFLDIVWIAYRAHKKGIDAGTAAKIYSGHVAAACTVVSYLTGLVTGWLT